MKTNQLLCISVAILGICTASTAQAQTPSVPGATIWRFMGIPQGFQRIRNATINRNGNFPGLERKPPLKAIADPANLASEDPAIKAAAEVKQAEDMKKQKIKAIKYLAEMGCGCYDSQGKITDALLAAMDDCTPDVRLAAIEAIETSASGECCKKCGSTSCCSEKVTTRLSEIAYERDDTGCCLEPNADVREAAAKALNVCCPNRATGPIEEEVPEQEDETKTDDDGGPLKGEREEGSDAIEGERSGEGSDDAEMIEELPQAEQEASAIEESDSEKNAIESADTAGLPIEEDMILRRSAQVGPLRVGSEKAEPTEVETAQVEVAEADPAQEQTVKVKVGTVKMIGGMAIQPVTISPVGATQPAPVAAPIPTKPVSWKLSDKSSAQPISEARLAKTPALPKPVTLPTPVALPTSDSMRAPVALPAPVKLPAVDAKLIDANEVMQKARYAPRPVGRKKVVATVVGVDHRTGRVMLRSGQGLRVNASVTVYHHYLTGERLVAHLLIKNVNGSQAVAMVTDKAGLSEIHSGDRAVCF